MGMDASSSFDTQSSPSTYPCLSTSHKIGISLLPLQRFHGAFTGGFSAGYFNTVGSKVVLLMCVKPAKMCHAFVLQSVQQRAIE